VRIESSLTVLVVVVRSGRSRKRYERQGLLVEPDALDRADAAMSAEVGAAATARRRRSASD
jgi:hypothetical protein